MKFDPAALVSVAGGDDALARELADLFLMGSPRHLVAISRAIDAGDARALEFAAHSLRGSAASLTAREIALTAGTLEAMGATNDMRGAPIILTELILQMTSLSEMLDRSWQRESESSRGSGNATCSQVPAHCAS